MVMPYPKTIWTCLLLLLIKSLLKMICLLRVPISIDVMSNGDAIGWFYAQLLDNIVENISDLDNLFA